MPWTPAHIAAVVPLRRWCPAVFSFPALCVGAMMPDAFYYVFAFELSTFAHTLPGSLLVCVPSGLVALGALVVVRRPLWHALPEPHRSAFEDMAHAPVDLGLRRALIVASSVLLGAWTHIAWDGFTHSKDGFLPGLSPMGYHVLQELSTLGGTVILLLAYRAWLKRRRAEAPPSRLGDDRWRWALWAGVVLVAAAIASALAVEDATPYTGIVAVRVFLFRGALYGTAIATVLALCAVPIAYRLAMSGTPAAGSGSASPRPGRSTPPKGRG